MAKDVDAAATLAHTAKILAGYVGNNLVRQQDLPALMAQIHTSLGCLPNGAPPRGQATLAKQPVPAVPVSQSVKPDHLVCLNCGGEFKMLKGHLVRHGMTPDKYRAYWNLPSDYPIVARAHSEWRSALAKSWSFGKLD